MVTLQEIVSVLGLEYPQDRTSVNVECPFCGQGRRRKTFNINYDKNVYNCPRCGQGGGVLDFWAIHRHIEEVGEKERRKLAAKDMANYFETPASKKVVKKVETIKEVPCISLDIRDKTYKNFLDILKLSEDHKSRLRNRGLSEEAILQNGYKTYPQVGQKEICKALLEQGNVLEGVPGFYKEDGEWKLLPMKNGMLIPVKTGRGEIQGFQIRMDTVKEGDPKYLTWSSSQYGARGHAFVHCNKGEKGYEEIIITEGPLKADVISYFTGYMTLGVPGVNSLKYLHGYLRPLKELKTQKIHIAYDMDLYNNKQVIKALGNLKAMIISYGFSCSLVTWPIKYKGLDDYLLVKKHL